MKKLLACGAVLVVGFGLGRVSQPQPANAERAVAADSAPLPPCQDINGDGLSDVSDAVYFLQWKFVGGPQPRCDDWCCLPSPSEALPDTGQTKCYDIAHHELDCASCPEQCLPGQDGFLATGCPTQGRFTDNKHGTVTDRCTGLMWQQETADVKGDGESGDDDITAWPSALEYCENLDFAGHKDWRLPNVRELQSIVDYGRRFPAIDPVFQAQSARYWSSTTASNPLAWFVLFDTGGIECTKSSGDKNTISTYVRAVRTIQPGE